MKVKAGQIYKADNPGKYPSAKISTLDKHYILPLLTAGFGVLSRFALFYDTWSHLRTFSVMHDHTFSEHANHQIGHQDTHIVGCQPGHCIWSLHSSSGVCAGMYGLTYSFYHHEGPFSRRYLRMMMIQHCLTVKKWENSHAKTREKPFYPSLQQSSV